MRICPGIAWDRSPVGSESPLYEDACTGLKWYVTRSTTGIDGRLVRRVEHPEEQVESPLRLLRSMTT